MRRAIDEAEIEIKEVKQDFANRRKGASTKVADAQRNLASFADSVRSWLSDAPAARAAALRHVEEASAELTSLHRSLLERIRGAMSDEVETDAGRAPRAARAEAGPPPTTATGTASAAPAASSRPQARQVPSTRTNRPATPAARQRPNVTTLRPQSPLILAVPRGVLGPTPHAPIPLCTRPTGVSSDVLNGLRPLSLKETPDFWETLSRVAWEPLQAVSGDRSRRPSYTYASALACLSFPGRGWASRDVLAAAAGVRFRGLLRLLHPDHWDATWATARTRVAQSWALVPVSNDAQIAPAPPPPNTTAPRYWTEGMLRVAASDAFNRIQLARESFSAGIS